MKPTPRHVWDRYMEVMEEQYQPQIDRMACRSSYLCLNCDIPLVPSSGGKFRCDKCGYILPCCDPIA